MQDSDELTRDVNYQPENAFGNECTGIYYLRLQRDGWTLKERHRDSKYNHHAIFDKELVNGWILIKKAHEQIDSP